MSDVPWRVHVTNEAPQDVLTAVRMEIERHRRASIRCRIGFHDPAPWFVDFYAYVQVRRCYRCGCALEARDVLQSQVESDQSGVIELYRGFGRRSYTLMMPQPHMNRGKVTTGPG